MEYINLLICTLFQRGAELMKMKPEFGEIIEPKIQDLSSQFSDLETMTKEKGERLFDANREVLLHQTCDDIDTWMNDLEKQIESEELGNDLASVNILMQKQQVNEKQKAFPPVCLLKINGIYLAWVHFCWHVIIVLMFLQKFSHNW